MISTRYSCSIVKKIEFSRQIFEKYSNINVGKSAQWKPSCSMGGWGGKTDGLKLIVLFINSANAPNKLDDLTQPTVRKVSGS